MKNNDLPGRSLSKANKLRFIKKLPAYRPMSPENPIKMIDLRGKSDAFKKHQACWQYDKGEHLKLIMRQPFNNAELKFKYKLDQHLQIEKINQYLAKGQPIIGEDSLSQEDTESLDLSV